MIIIILLIVIIGITLKLKKAFLEELKKNRQISSYIEDKLALEKTNVSLRNEIVKLNIREGLNLENIGKIQKDLDIELETIRRLKDETIPKLKSENTIYITENLELSEQIIKFKNKIFELEEEIKALKEISNLFTADKSKKDETFEKHKYLKKYT